MKKRHLKELFERMPLLEVLLEELYNAEVATVAPRRSRLPWTPPGCTHPIHDPEPDLSNSINDPEEPPVCAVCDHDLDIIFVHDFEMNGAESAAED